MCYLAKLREIHHFVNRKDELIVRNEKRRVDRKIKFSELVGRYCVMYASDLLIAVIAISTIKCRNLSKLTAVL